MHHEKGEHLYTFNIDTRTSAHLQCRYSNICTASMSILEYLHTFNVDTRTSAQLQCRHSNICTASMSTLEHLHSFNVDTRTSAQLQCLYSSCSQMNAKWLHCNFTTSQTGAKWWKYLDGLSLRNHSRYTTTTISPLSFSLQYRKVLLGGVLVHDTCHHSTTRRTQEATPSQERNASVAYGQLTVHVSLRKDWPLKVPYH
jgi:hypothetical protein